MTQLFDFHHFNLTAQQIYSAAAIFTGILLVVVVLGLTFFGKNEKKLAWTISVVNSGAMSVVGVIYLWRKLDTFPLLFTFADYGVRPFHGLDNVAVLVTVWFALANIVDLLFGLVYYPKQLGLLTAHIHHSVFIWIMWTSSTGNGLFLTANPFAPAFSLMLIEEIPTFLLALGSIVPALRTDIGFGATFFLLRIVYHIFIFAYALKSGVETVVAVLYTLTLTLHLFWFYGWVTKYSGIGGKKNKPKAV